MADVNKYGVDMTGLLEAVDAATKLGAERVVVQNFTEQEEGGWVCDLRIEFDKEEKREGGKEKGWLKR